MQQGSCNLSVQGNEGKRVAGNGLGNLGNLLGIISVCSYINTWYVDQKEGI